jgi:hypothetical protein
MKLNETKLQDIIGMTLDTCQFLNLSKSITKNIMNQL